MKLSVAMCTYNGDRYIEPMLRSVAAQTLPVDELVVCDDSSTDSTVDHISQLATQLGLNLRLYHSQRLGLVCNSQRAIDLCTGDIIFIADQDDAWHADKTTKVVAWLQSHPEVDVLFTNATLIDGIGAPLPGTLFDHYFSPQKRAMFDSGRAFSALSSNYATAPTMAIRSRFAKANPFAKYADAGISNDYIIALLAAAQDRLGYIAEPLIDYRIHASQMLGLSGKWGGYLDPVSTEDMLATLPPVADTATRLEQWMNALRFVQWRHRTKHRPTALVYIPLYLGRYRRYYGASATQVAWTDLCQCANHSWQRLKNKIAR